MKNINEILPDFYSELKRLQPNTAPVLQSVSQSLAELIAFGFVDSIEQYCMDHEFSISDPLERFDMVQLLHEDFFFREAGALFTLRFRQKFISGGGDFTGLLCNCRIITPQTAWSYNLNEFGRLVMGQVKVGSASGMLQTDILQRTWLLDGGGPLPCCADALPLLGTDLLALTMPSALLADPIRSPHMYLLSVGGRTIDGNFGAGDNNTCSVGLLFTLEDFAYFTAGDMPEAEEDAVAQCVMMAGIGGRTLRCIPVFKLSHHASEYSTSQTFLNTIQPHCALISCGGAGEFDHPREVILGRLQNMTVIEHVFLTGCVPGRNFTVQDDSAQGAGPLKAFIAGSYEEGSGSILTEYEGVPGGMPLAVQPSFSVSAYDLNGGGKDITTLFTCTIVF